ncbi:hypothetical protein EAG_07290 [Camponotus floridanus]|uniref:Uncharacterized protein n=1 Tax=Camponotus floridanus TaxID=104421 RepID=E2A2T3_CAMFO|nr:hypothetical protein EAG_07290 [Camponotus floridanus]
MQLRDASATAVNKHFVRVTRKCDAYGAEGTVSTLLYAIARSNRPNEVADFRNLLSNGPRFNCSTVLNPSRGELRGVAMAVAVSPSLFIYREVLGRLATQSRVGRDNDKYLVGRGAVLTHSIDIYGRPPPDISGVITKVRDYNDLASQSWNKWQLIDKISLYSENNTLYSCIVTTYSSMNIFSKQTLPISISLARHRYEKQYRSCIANSCFNINLDMNSHSPRCAKSLPNSSEKSIAETSISVFHKLQDKNIRSELDSLNSICMYNHSSFIAKVQACYSKLPTSLQTV